MKVKYLSSKIMRAKKLKLLPVFPLYTLSKDFQSHFDTMRKILIRQLSNPLPFCDQESLKKWIEETVPCITWNSLQFPPGVLTLFFLVKPFSSVCTENFILQIIKRSLIPHQKVTILSFKQMEFYFELYRKTPLFVAEMKILIPNKKEAIVYAETLPLLKREMTMAFAESRYAQIFLEAKLFPCHDKMSLVRELFIQLIHRFPDQLNADLFDEIALLHAQTSKKFQEERSYVHLAKIILTLFLLENAFYRKLNFFPEKRHIKICMKPTQLLFTFGKKAVLGLCIAVNLFHEYEFFNEKHVLRAVQKIFPNARLVAGSAYQRHSLNSVATLYLEIEKNDGTSFTLGEKKELKKALEGELKKAIEHLLPAVFMVRNEEETMRNILMLSREIKSSDDLPQMMITFDRHSQEDLVFTIVLLRVRKKGLIPLQDLIKNVDPCIRFVLDRVQIVSCLNNQHLIEANVFRLQMTDLNSFLRIDFSVNLYLAREKVVSFLTKHLGEIRDYNGGLMVKQSELLTQFRRFFQESSLRDPELLENFFYSLNPIESQATLSLEFLSLFFRAFIRMTEKEPLLGQTYLVDVEKEQEVIVAVVRSNDCAFRLSLEEALSELQIQERSLISSILVCEGNYYLSYLYEESDQNRRRRFEEILGAALKKSQADQSKLKILKIHCPEPSFLDPRISGDQGSSRLLKLLFDGLMRIDETGKPQCAMAQRYEISEDKKTYTFYLKEALWSNGDPVTAYDFEYAWKSALSPEFVTPFRYIFNPIKNAREAKEGLVSLDEIGIFVPDEKTLIVELINPAPYFLELIANTLYFPVNRCVDQVHPNWSTQKDDHFVCNGPFKQVDPKGNNCYEFQKNLLFWNKQKIQIDAVYFNQLKAEDALQMFQKGQIDCVESDRSLMGIELDLKQLKGQVLRYHSPRVFWVCFNVTQFPFNHLKMRYAFSMAVSRNELLDWDLGVELPAYTPLCDQLSLCKESPHLIYEDEVKAKHLFLEALDEMQMKVEDFPVIYLSVTKMDRGIFEILKRQWERVLGVQCVFETSDRNTHLKKMMNKNYYLGGIYWISLVNDPIYTLQCFKYAKELINFTGWENPAFQKYLDQSNQAIDPDLRAAFFKKAEEVLIKEAVVLPIFYGTGWCIKASNLSFNLMSANGSVDFSSAFFKK